MKSLPGLSSGESPDYTVYHFSKSEWATNIFLFLALDACISCLFYRSLVVFLLLLPGLILFLKEQQKTCRKKQLARMQEQFLSAMQFVLSSLQAGYAMENAFREAERELGRIYPRDAFILREIRRINAGLRLNVPAEQLLLDLAVRTGAEDISQFAEIFRIARRSGGDMIAIVRSTIGQISQKQETLREIDTLLAGKKTEQNIMSAVPLLILSYVGLTSPEFLSGLYHNTAGVILMTLCLAVYGAAFLWARSIMEQVLRV